MSSLIVFSYLVSTSTLVLLLDSAYFFIEVPLDFSSEV